MACLELTEVVLSTTGQLLAGRCIWTACGVVQCRWKWREGGLPYRHPPTVPSLQDLGCTHGPLDFRGVKNGQAGIHIIDVSFEGILR